MTLAEAKEFIEQFIDDEYKALYIRFSEPDYDKYIEQTRYLQPKYYSGNLTDILSRSAYLTPEEFLEVKESQLASLKPRTLFQIRLFKHPKLKVIAACYVSSSHIYLKGTGYYDCFFIAKYADGIKIFSEYHLCTDCSGRGETEDGQFTCRTCRCDGWQHRQGMKFRSFRTPGKLQSIDRFNAPQNPKYKTLHEKD